VNDSIPPDVPLTPEHHVRKSIELRITVIGRQLEDQLIEMVDSGEDITLSSDSVSIAVSKVARADGLPIGVEKMFELWFAASGLRDSLKDAAKIAYLSGMEAVNWRNGKG